MPPRSRPEWFFVRAVIAVALMTVAGNLLAGPGERSLGEALHQDASPAWALQAPLPRLLRGQAGALLRGPSEASAEEIARTWMDEELGPAGEMALLGVVEGGGGVRFVSFEQRFGGIPVLLGRVDVAVTPDGSVLAARVGELAPSGPAPRAPVTRWSLPDDAAARAAAVRIARGGGPRAGLGDAEGVARAFVATATGVVPVWRVSFPRPARLEEASELVLDARDGRIRRATPLVFRAVAAGRVFPGDPDGPSVLASFPRLPDLPSVHSPGGWTDETNRTVGNNVVAQIDREADFFPPLGRIAEAFGDPPVLDFAFTGDVDLDQDAALTNVFWALNDAHDRFRALGFDEASGAFQDDNFARGGAGGDPVWALVQYASGDGTAANNAVFSGFNGDGSFSWVAVGLFDASGELRDAAFETDLLYHEYTHGVVTRLVGGEAACLQGIQPAALVEGWSDFFGASFTDDPVIGSWVSGEPATGLRRNALDRGTFTFRNFCFESCNAFNDGEIWSGALWDLRTALVDLYGPVEGARLAERLVLEGLRYTPCRPTFSQARDGILLADTALHDGAHRCLIWEALARRWIGWSTETTGPDDDDPTPSNDFGPECTGGATVLLDQTEYATDAEAVVEVVDTAPGALPLEVVVGATSGDSETLQLAPAPGGPLFRVVASLRPGAPVAGDGIVQVADGDVLTARYVAKDAEATAAVSAGIDLEIVTHRVWGNCREDPGIDDDYVEGFWNLTGFLDAGEVANLVVTFGNASPTALEDIEVEVTSLNPDVTVLPSTPLSGPGIPAQSGTQPLAFQAEFRALADPSVTTGDTAELLFDVRARGRATQVSLVLELNYDYLLEPAFSPFDGGVETFEASSSTAGDWTHQACAGTEDMWSLEACAGNGGAGYQNGSAGCGPYTWGQEGASLVSPSIFPLPADAVSLRVLDFDWENDIDLYTDRANRYCDADLVTVWVTPDPAALPCADPAVALASNPARAYLFTDNTGGRWSRSGPYGVNRNPVDLDPGTDYSAFRLAWLFQGDVFECFDTNLNTGHYRLDNLRFSYDLVRRVPETAPCDQSCVLMTRALLEPSSPLCPGEPLEIVAEATEAVGCPGDVRYAFSGPGVPAEFGWTLEQRAPAVAEEGGVYAVYAQCEDLDTCNDYREASVVSPAAPGIGAVTPGSLRASRRPDEVGLRWEGGAAPGEFGVWSVADPARLPDGLATWDPLVAATADEATGEVLTSVPLDEMAGDLVFFRAAPRDPCTDAPRLP